MYCKTEALKEIQNEDFDSDEEERNAADVGNPEYESLVRARKEFKRE